MQKRKFTVVAQLHKKHNKEIIEYVDGSLAIYSEAKRKTFREILNTEASGRKFDKSKYNTFLQTKYQITKRCANSIISDAQGIYNALKELRSYELREVESKIEYLEKELLPKLKEKRDANSLKLKEFPNKESLILAQRNLRRKIVAKKNKLNHLKQRKKNLEHQIETKKFKICFGTKKLLRQNYRKFVAQRDSQLNFVGAKEEPNCNQNLQLFFLPESNQFIVKLRKEFNDFTNASKEKKFAYGRCQFHYQKNTIIEILNKHCSPLSYKIIKRRERYYLHCTFEIAYEDTEVIRRRQIGVIGLDFNKGFITSTETNHYGHMVHTDLFPYRFQKGDATETDLYEIANQVVKQAKETEKSIAIENLDFKKTKSKTEAGQGKKYNDMIHSFAYREFVTIIESVAYKNKVEVIKVNPAWTSWLAEKIYCNKMKLNIHTGASFVIARRGQGFKDSYKKNNVA